MNGEANNANKVIPAWYLNRALLVLLVADGLSWVAVTMIGPIYAFFVDEVGGAVNF